MRWLGDQMSGEYPRGKWLFRGQRVAKGHHCCDVCGRSIGPGETYTVKVYLMIEGPLRSDRYVITSKRCGC